MASFCALSGLPETSAVTFEASHLAKAGRIWLMLRLPSPTTAHPSLRPGGSGTRWALAAPAATCDAIRLAPACCRNPRRVRRSIGSSVMAAILDQPQRKAEDGQEPVGIRLRKGADDLAAAGRA